MKLVFYIVTAALGAYVSAEGHRVSYAAIEVAGAPGSSTLFEYGQWVYIIAGAISILLTAAALFEILNKIRKM